jgi:multiple sugar transport system substrate-binding protein
MKHHRQAAFLLLIALVASSCAPATTLTPTAAQVQQPPTQAPTSQVVQPTNTAAPVKLVFWSHWSTEPTKQEVLRAAAAILEERHPNVKVEFTWWNKTDMFAAMRNAFTAGTGFPDIFYWDRLALEFIPAGWLDDLTTDIDWSQVQGWAKDSWTRPGPDGKTGVWAVPLETETEEIYYNKDIFDRLGVTVPDNYTFTADEFYDLCVKARAAGYDCFSNAIGDYSTMAAYLNNYVLVRQLGADDLISLFEGKKSWEDPDVVEAMTYVKRLLDIPVYPATFSTMKLVESHVYFHTQQKAAMFMVGSWYTGRAFVPPDKGGQPAGFRLGMLRYPNMPNGKGDNIRLSAVAGAISVADKSPNKALALELLQIIASTDIGNLWVEKTAGQTGMITTTTGGPWEDYFTEYNKVHQGETVVPFTYAMIAPPDYNQTYLAVLCQGLPLGQVTLQQALDKMEEARLAIPQ